MVTQVISKIGATNSPTTMDYSTISTWAATISDPVAADSQYIGQIYNQGVISLTSTANITASSGDTTHKVILTAGPGQGFQDYFAANSATATLSYNESQGAAINGSFSYAGLLGYGGEIWFEIYGLQMYKRGNGAGVVTNSGGAQTGFFCHECIFDNVDNFTVISYMNNSATLPDRSNNLVQNCLVINTGNNRSPVFAGNSGHFVNNTVVNPNSNGGSALSVAYGSAVAYNNALFGYATAISDRSGGSGSNNFTDATSWSGTGISNPGTDNVPYTTSTFKDIAVDLRTVSGSPLIAAAANAFAPTIDILGNPRPTATPASVGAYEAPPSASVGSITGTSTVNGFAASLGSASGTASANGTGSALATASGTITGTSTANGTGKSTAQSGGSITGVATANGSGSSQAVSGGSITGSSTVNGVGQDTITASGSISGQASLTGNASALATTSASIAVQASVTGNASALATATGAITGSTTVTATGQESIVASGTITGQASLTATGQALVAASSAIAGQAAVSGIGAAFGTAGGSIVGQATVTASGLASAVTSGAIAVQAAVMANSAALISATGTINGSSTVTGTSANTSPATGIINGTTTVVGNVAVPPPPVVISSQGLYPQILFDAQEAMQAPNVVPPGHLGLIALDMYYVDLMQILIAHLSPWGEDFSLRAWVSELPNGISVIAPTPANYFPVSRFTPRPLVLYTARQLPPSGDPILAPVWNTRYFLNIQNLANSPNAFSFLQINLA